MNARRYRGNIVLAVIFLSACGTAAAGEDTSSTDLFKRGTGYPETMPMRDGHFTDDRATPATERHSDMHGNQVPASTEQPEKLIGFVADDEC
jgi:hypothetical protein